MLFALLRYNVPRAFLNPKGNLLVVQEEESGDPLKISIGTVSVTNVCGHVTDSHPPPIISWTTSDDGNESHHGKIPKVQLRCPPSSNISKITFASFGTPVGGCESYAIGSCHSPNSLAVAEKVRTVMLKTITSSLLPSSNKRQTWLPKNGGKKGELAILQPNGAAMVVWLQVSFLFSSILSAI